MNRLTVNLTTAFANAPQCRLSLGCWFASSLLSAAAIVTLFFCLRLVNVPGSCNVGSNDAYLSDSPYGCSGPSFSQYVKQKTNDVLPLFFPEPETAPFRGPHVSSQMYSVDRQKVCRR
jgi:hypothetical protein